MPDTASDPGLYLAAERTLLAWLRTGISVMVFGFVVARFGLFLRLLRAQEGLGPSHGLSPILGATLVGLGVLASGGGAVQYLRFCRTLPPGDRPAAFSPWAILGLAWALVVVGVGLGFVLVV